MWVRWDNGQEEELKPVANSVSARQGHKVCSIDIEGPKATARDEIRANLTTNHISYRRKSRLCMEAIFGRSFSFWGPLSLWIAIFIIGAPITEAMGVMFILSIAGTVATVKVANRNYNAAEADFARAYQELFDEILGKNQSSSENTSTNEAAQVSGERIDQKT